MSVKDVVAFISLYLLTDKMSMKSERGWSKSITG